MLRFAQSVKEWLNADPENVIVVHCKGIFFYKTNSVFWGDLKKLPVFEFILTTKSQLRIFSNS